MRPYYEAYEERYRAIHAKGLRWAGEQPTPLVADVAARYCPIGAKLLEIGCGEGRDARELLAQGYDLTATDVSPEAISFCRDAMPEHAARFQLLDCLRDTLPARFDMVYAVAVVHMLVEDGDRRCFYRFLGAHLKPGGVGLVCSMGDGETELQTDVSEAFELREREHPAGPQRVAATSCRMVSFPIFAREIEDSGLVIVERGFTSAMPDFDSLMYAVVRTGGHLLT